MYGTHINAKTHCTIWAPNSNKRRANLSCCGYFFVSSSSSFYFVWPVTNRTYKIINTILLRESFCELLLFSCSVVCSVPFGTLSVQLQPVYTSLGDYVLVLKFQRKWKELDRMRFVPESPSVRPPKSAVRVLFSLQFANKFLLSPSCSCFRLFFSQLSFSMACIAGWLCQLC